MMEIITYVCILSTMCMYVYIFNEENIQSSFWILYSSSEHSDQKHLTEISCFQLSSSDCLHSQSKKGSQHNTTGRREVFEDPRNSTG